MPSPKRGILVSAIASEWFLPIADDGEHASIPSSIMPGITATLEGSIKVLIRRCDEPCPSGSQLFTQKRLFVQATMPWLNRHLPFFDSSRVLDIQYPVKLQTFRSLPSMGQGSMSQFTFEVRATEVPHDSDFRNTESSYSQGVQPKLEGIGNYVTFQAAC